MPTISSLHFNVTGMTGYRSHRYDWLQVSLVYDWLQVSPVRLITTDKRRLPFSFDPLTPLAREFCAFSWEGQRNGLRIPETKTVENNFEIVLYQDLLYQEKTIFIVTLEITIAEERVSMG